jgi:hypothetical protein
MSTVGSNSVGSNEKCLEFIIRGDRAEVYEALLKEKNNLMGIKVYISSVDSNEKIKSEYTSLVKIVDGLISSKPKILLSDDV